MPPIMTLPQATTESDAPDLAVPHKTPKPRSRWILRTSEFLILLVIAVFALESFFKFAGIGEQEFLEPDK